MDGLPVEYTLPLGGNVMIKISDFINIRKYWNNDKNEMFPGPNGVCLKGEEFIEFVLSLEEIQKEFDNFITPQ